MRVHVDSGKCIASGMCTSFVPELFELDEDGALKVLSDVVPAEAEAAVADAVACCPVEAISTSP
jgi:ferredoxin